MADDNTPQTGIDSAIDQTTSSGPTPKENVNANGVANRPTPNTFGADVDSDRNQNDLLSMQENTVTRLILSPPKLKIPEFTTKLYQHQQFDYSRLMNTARDKGRAQELVDAGQDPGPARAQLSRKPSSYLLQETQATATMGIYQFHRTVSTNYMRKMLALSYHQNTTLNSMQKASVQMGKMLEAKLEAIKLNTAAPEARKASNFARLREEFRIQNIRAVAGFARNQIGAFAAPRINRYIAQPLARRSASFFNKETDLSDTANASRDYVADILEKGSRQAARRGNGISNPTIRNVAARTTLSLDKAARAVANTNLSPQAKARLTKLSGTLRSILPNESIANFINTFVKDVSTQDTAGASDADGGDFMPNQTQTKAKAPTSSGMSDFAAAASDPCCSRLLEATGKFQKQNLSYLKEIVRLLGGGTPQGTRGSSGPTPSSPQGPSAPRGPIIPPHVHDILNTARDRAANAARGSSSRLRNHLRQSVPSAHAWNTMVGEALGAIPTGQDVRDRLTSRAARHGLDAHAWNTMAGTALGAIPTGGTVRDHLTSMAARHGLDAHTWNNTVSGLASHIPTSRDDLASQGRALRDRGLMEIAFRREQMRDQADRLREGIHRGTSEREQADRRIAGFRVRHRGPMSASEHLAQVLGRLDRDIRPHDEHHERLNSYEELRNHHDANRTTTDHVRDHGDQHLDDHQTGGILGALAGLLGSLGSGGIASTALEGLAGLLGLKGGIAGLRGLSKGQIVRKLGGRLLGGAWGLGRRAVHGGVTGVGNLRHLSELRNMSAGQLGRTIGRNGVTGAGHLAASIARHGGRAVWGLGKGIFGSRGGTGAGRQSLFRRGLGVLGKGAHLGARGLWGATRFGAGLVGGAGGAIGSGVIHGALHLGGRLLGSGFGLGLAGAGINALTNHFTTLGGVTNTLGHMAGNAAEYGAMGSIFGPWGTALGALTGAGVALFQGVAGKDAKIDHNGKVISKPNQGLFGTIKNMLGISQAHADTTLTPDRLAKLNANQDIKHPDYSKLVMTAGGGNAYTPPPSNVNTGGVNNPTHGGNLDTSIINASIDNRRIMDQPAFQSVFKKLPKEIADRVGKSNALQFAVWSTSIQYGPKKCLDYITKSWRPGEDDLTFIRKLFQMRDANLNSLSASERISAISQNAQESNYATGLASGVTTFNFAAAATAAGAPNADLVGANSGAYTPHPAPTSAEVKKRAKIGIAYLMKKGWTQAQATGIIANLVQESGLDPQVRPGDGGTAVGMAQWHPDRQAAIKRHFGVDSIYKLNFTQQLDAVDWELNNTEGGAGKKLKEAKTPQEAGQIVSKYYERPGNTPQARAQEQANRGAIAMNLAKDFGTIDPSAPASGTQVADAGGSGAQNTPPGGGGSDGSAGGAPSQQQAQATAQTASATTASNTASASPAPSAGGGDSTGSGSSAAATPVTANTIASNVSSGSNVDALHDALKTTNKHLATIASHTSGINGNTKTMADNSSTNSGGSGASGGNTGSGTTVINQVTNTNIQPNHHNTLSTAKSANRSGVG